MKTQAERDLEREFFARRLGILASQGKSWEQKMREVKVLYELHRARMEDLQRKEPPEGLR